MKKTGIAVIARADQWTFLLTLAAVLAAGALIQHRLDRILSRLGSTKGDFTETQQR